MQETYSWERVVSHTLDRIPTFIIIFLLLLGIVIILIKGWPIVHAQLTSLLSTAVHQGINGAAERINQIELLLEQILIQQQQDSVQLATLDTQVKILMERRIQHVANVVMERRKQK